MNWNPVVDALRDECLKGLSLAATNDADFALGRMWATRNVSRALGLEEKLLTELKYHAARDERYYIDRYWNNKEHL